MPTNYQDIKVGAIFLFEGDSKAYVKCVRNRYKPIGLWDFKPLTSTGRPYVRFISSLRGELDPPVDTNCRCLVLHMEKPVKTTI